MKRQTVYAGQVPLETDLLNTNKNVLTAIGHVLQDMLGTSTLFSGLGCVPTAPAGMTVNVNPGRAYSLQAIDTGAWSSLSADAHQIMKQGILLDVQNFACPAPGTAGFSINYLIQGAFQEVDTGSTVLPYYNASNPQQAYNGPNGTGTSQTTARDNTVQLQLKAGVAATTGSQVTPTPDAGFTGLWVVTVAFGQSTITSTSIAQYPGAPFLPASLLQMIQQGSSNYAVATGTANAHVAAFTPPITARVDGMVLRYKAPAANTGALTFNDGLGAVAVVGAAHSALQGGETATNGDVWLQWNSSIGGGSYVMLDSTGGALQVGAATQSQHALQLGQFSATAISTGLVKTVKIQVVQSSGTYTPSTGMVYCIVEVVGGGGGGGGANGGSGTGAAGGGGGAGGYVKSVFSAATIGASQTVTVGSAGANGTAGNAGGAGGNTSFGALLTAGGGQGGGGALANSAVGAINLGGAGGTASGGQVNIQGAAGGVGIGFGSTGGTGGFGGGSPLGVGGQNNVNGTGNPGAGRGSAGGGGSASTASALGGAGQGGVVVITEFCTQ